jgi:hypothetical protein
MISLSILFVIVFFLVTVILILFPKRNLIRAIRKEMDPAFDPKKVGMAYTARAYYSILIFLSCTVSAAIVGVVKYFFA